MTIGERLKTRLEELELKQNELAKRLKISPTTLNGYFTDYREPDLKTLEKLAIELETSVEYLVTGRDSTSPGQSEDDEMWELRREMSEREEMKTLFDLARDAKKEDLEFANDLLKRLRGKGGN